MHWRSLRFYRLHVLDFELRLHTVALNHFVPDNEDVRRRKIHNVHDTGIGDAVERTVAVDGVDDCNVLKADALVC